MKKLIFALVAGVAAASAMSAAQAEGYVGVGVVTTDHDFNVAGAPGGSSDGYKASGKIFGGLELDKTWGVEAGYTDFRKSHYNYLAGTTASSLSSDGHAYYVAGKGTMPLNDQFSLFGKLGVARTKSSLSSSSAAIASVSDSSTGAYGAIGAQYNLSKQVALTAEYERYGKQRDFGSKADAFTVAAKFNF